MIREATKNDITDIVNIHLSTLSNDFFPKLGKKILTLIYKHSTNSKMYVYIVNNSIKGFIIVSFKKPSVPFSLINLDFYQLFFLTIWKVIKNPFLFKYLIEYFIYSMKKNPFTAEIVTLAVMPQWQKKNIGTQLVNRVEEELYEKKIYMYKVITKSTHLSANQFYKKIGFSLNKKMDLFGKKRNVYIKYLNNA